MKKYKRIKIDAEKMGGVPCIRDLRMPIATIIEMFAEGYDTKQILTEYPELQIEDIQEALHFASEALSYREIHLAI